MTLRRALVCALVLSVAPACGDDDPNLLPLRDSSDNGDGDDDASSGDDSSGSDASLPDAPMDEEGPDNVTIEAPTADEVVTGERVTVRCTASPDANTQSPLENAEISILDSKGKLETATVTALQPGLFESTLLLSSMSNGLLTVQCVVSDEASSAQSARQEAYLDLGPKITIARPGNGEALRRVLEVDFTVVASPAIPGDTMAGVEAGSVKATIAGKDVTDLLVDEGSGRWRATISTDDDRFSPALAGTNSIKIEATNERGVTRSVRRTFVVDTTGPVINIISPEQAALVGGIVTVTAEVTDANGVNPATVLGVFGAGTVDLGTFPLTLVTGNTYEGSYDTRELRATVEAIYGDGVKISFPSISVRAQDNPGNQSRYGYQVWMDYTPPVVDMNPPHHVEGTFTSDGLTCSYPFDPLGIDAVNDRQSVAQVSEFRALAFDNSNFLDGATDSGVYFPFADINPATVQMFIFPAATAAKDALVVDTDGDGECDDINPLMLPGVSPVPGDEAIGLDLTGIAATGATIDDPDPEIGICDPADPPDSTPEMMCPGSSGLQRIADSGTDIEPLIWSIGPILDDSACVGQPFDALANQVPDGWACVATRAEDGLGNVGVSRPLRVCFDHDGDGEDANGNPVCPDRPTYFPGPDYSAGGGNPFTNDADIPLGNPPMDCYGVYDRMTDTTNHASSCGAPATWPEGSVMILD